MKIDSKGFVTARATVVPFRPPTFPLAYDIAEGDGGGRFIVAREDLDKVTVYESCTVRFFPADQFARIVVSKEVA